MQMQALSALYMPIVAVLVGHLRSPAIATERLVFDVGVSGTSRVEECLLDGSCFQYASIGRISLALEATRPRLENIDSVLLEPPGAPSPASGFGWRFLSYTIGDYLTESDQPDVSMRFFPNPVIDPPGLLFRFDGIKP